MPGDNAKKLAKQERHPKRLEVVDRDFDPYRDLDEPALISLPDIFSWVMFAVLLWLGITIISSALDLYDRFSNHSAQPSNISTGVRNGTGAVKEKMQRSFEKLREDLEGYPAERGKNSVPNSSEKDRAASDGIEKI